MRHPSFLAALAAVFALGGFPAIAMDDLVTGRLLTGWRADDGHHVAGIRLELRPGWKTYWRAPGDAGIPPRFDWDRSANLSGAEPRWPVPVVFDDNGMRSVGYVDDVVIPLVLRPSSAGAPITLDAEMQIGVCDDICVPVTLRIAGELSATGSGPGSEMIEAALADRPMTEREAGVGKAVCAVDPISDGLRVAMTVDVQSMGSSEEAVIEFADPSVWVSVPTINREGGRLTATAEMVPPDGRPFALTRDGVRLTILGANGAVDIHGCAAG